MLVCCHNVKTNVVEDNGGKDTDTEKEEERTFTVHDNSAGTKVRSTSHSRGVRD